MEVHLHNKIALVTGGGSGIGAAICQVLAGAGAEVIVSDINLEAAQQVATNIISTGAIARSLSLDVSDEASWESAMADISRLDIVVNNAGLALPGDVETASLSDWKITQAVNGDGVFLGTQYGIAKMKAQGGSIINISSIEGLIGEPKAAAYNYSKGGVRILSKSAALHCASQGYGIRVNSLHPGYVETPLIANAAASLPETEAEAFLQRILGEIPIGRLAQPQEVANACLFLASDLSSYMTGSELVVDGGYTAH